MTMWTIAWNILVSLAKSKIGRVLIGLAIIGFFYVGFRIWLLIHDASVAREATSQMVTKFERDTLASQLAEERRRAQQAARITEEYRKRTEAAEQANAAAQDRLEKAIAEDTATDSPNWTPADFVWLCQHGQARYCSR